MTDPTNPPTPAEIAGIIAEANRVERLCLCPNVRPVCETVTAGRVCPSFAALLACAERGIAPPSGEVEWALGYLDSIAIRVHDTENEREKAFDILRRLSAPPVAAPSGEVAELIEKLWRVPLAEGADPRTIRRAIGLLSTLSDGKAAAEAKIERQRERIVYLEGATNHATGTPLSIAESRCAALERALRDLEWITNGENSYRYCPSCYSQEIPNYKHWPDCELRVALSSAETAKPGMPECAREFPRAKGDDRDNGWTIEPSFLLALCDAVELSDNERPSMEVAEQILLAIESYYAKPSATAGEEK